MLATKCMSQGLHTMKQSLLVQLLHTAACVLQTCSLSYKNTDVKDALSHLEAETSNHFPPKLIQLRWTKMSMTP